MPSSSTFARSEASGTLKATWNRSGPRRLSRRLVRFTFLRASRGVASGFIRVTVPCLTSTCPTSRPRTQEPDGSGRSRAGRPSSERGTKISGWMNVAFSTASLPRNRGTIFTPRSKLAHRTRGIVRFMLLQITTSSRRMWPRRVTRTAPMDMGRSSVPATTVVTAFSIHAVGMKRGQIMKKAPASRIPDRSAASKKERRRRRGPLEGVSSVIGLSGSRRPVPRSFF